jgi:hypothetical protein
MKTRASSEPPGHSTAATREAHCHNLTEVVKEIRKSLKVQICVSKSSAGKLGEGTLMNERPMDAVLLVLEDLHWSDHSTLDLLAMLGQRQESMRLLVVGSYRPVDAIVATRP